MKADALELAQALTRNDRRVAENAWRAGLAKDADTFIRYLRKEGTLRFSRYDFASDILTRLLKGTLEGNTITLSAESLRYLRSMEALDAIAPAVRRRFLRIRETINARSFKSYLVTIDCLFREKHERVGAASRKLWSE